MKKMMMTLFALLLAIGLQNNAFAEKIDCNGKIAVNENSPSVFEALYKAGIEPAESTSSASFYLQTTTGHEHESNGCGLVFCSQTKYSYAIAILHKKTSDNKWQLVTKVTKQASNLDHDFKFADYPEVQPLKEKALDSLLKKFCK